MLSIGKLTAGRAAYYVTSMPGGADEYYLTGESPGVWLGSAGRRLGVSGRVDARGFERILAALDPSTGEALGVPATTDRRVAGFDLTFSAPKSVSLAWALSAPDVAAVVAAAHDAAVADALGVLEVEAVRARRGAGGQRLVETGGVVAAGFAHRTSRAGDPQMHTHVVVANLTVDADGRWSAIDGTSVYRWARTVGFLYQAALRHHLTEDLGVGWTPVVNGTAEMAGITRPQLEAFSTRRAGIVAEMARVGASSARAAQTATLATRPPKPADIDLGVLRAAWEATAAEVGLAPERLTAPAWPRPMPDLPAAARIAEQLSADGLTRQASGFDRRDILRALAQAAASGSPATALRADADRLTADPDVISLDAPGPAGARWTTRELLDVEHDMLTRAARRADAGLGIASPTAIKAALHARPTLSEEQRAMITRLTTSGAGVDVVIGRAGTGKTFALDAARAAWAASGRPVIGAALAARAAAELQTGAGIPSTTVDGLLADWSRPDPNFHPPRGSLLIIDEAGMVGTRTMRRLLAYAEAGAVKVVLVGDPRQLPEIDAGGALAGLAATVGSIDLVDNRRQHDPWEIDALSELRAGHVPAAVVAYAEHGRLTLAATAADARSRLVDDWWAARTGGAAVGMYALRRADVAALNYAGRARLDAAGLLGTDRLIASGSEYAAGDAVLCLRNDRRAGLRNGLTGTVTAVHLEAGEVTLDDGRRIAAAYLTAGHVTHGYATTVHKAQGATVDQALVLGSDALYREAGYVALSRARQRTDMYLVDPGPADAGRDPHLRTDPVAELTRTLSASRAQTLAAHQQPRLAIGQPLPPADETRTLATLTAEQDRLLAHLGTPPGDRAGQSAWLGSHYDDLTAIRALSGAVELRRAQLRRAVLADPPAWAVSALGSPPAAGAARQRWAERAETVAAYRDTRPVQSSHDPGTPCRATDDSITRRVEGAVGPRPADVDAGRDWDLARIAIADSHRSLDHQLDHGRTR